MSFLRSATALLALGVAAAPAVAQPPTVSVPRVISVTGTFVPADGSRPNATEVVTLTVYAEEAGTAPPLWQETQTVTIDAAGRYALLLGATHDDGVPVELFAGGEARWLGLLFARPGEVEGPRTRLAAVPYALHAASADTLGGRPASDYLLAVPAAGKEGTAKPSSSLTALIDPQAVLPGTPNFIAKYVNTVDVANSALFEADGKVGIGTTTPLDYMHVRFTNGTGQFTGYAVQNLGNTATSYSGMLFYDQSGNLGQFQGFNNVTHEYRINNIARNEASAFDGSINFLIGGASRFFVGANANVGIGTTTPQAPFEVVRGGFADAFFTSYTGAASSGTFIDGRKARGTVGAPAAVLGGDLLVAFRGSAYDSFNFVPTAFIEFRAAGDWSPSSRPSDIRFFTGPAASNFGQERMRITQNGNVGIGLESPADRLQVVGDIRVGNLGSNGCVRAFDGTPIAGSCSSDRRFKRDITPFAQMLESVAALRPVHYYWRPQEFPDRQFGRGRTAGLIAQEVEQVLPDLVATDGDGYKTVDYSKLPLLAVQAIKELKERNDLLELRVAELERMLKRLMTETARH